MYWDALDRYPLKTVGETCRELSQTCHFFPMPADFKEYIHSLPPPYFKALPEPEPTEENLRWGKAQWRYIKQLISTGSEWDPEAFREFMVEQGFSREETDRRMVENERNNQSQDVAEGG